MSEQALLAHREVVSSTQLRRAQRIMFRFCVPGESFLPASLRDPRSAKSLPTVNVGKGFVVLKKTGPNWSVNVSGIINRLTLDNKTAFVYARITLEKQENGAFILRITIKHEADECEDANYTAFEAAELATALAQLHGAVTVFDNPDPLPRNDHDRMIVISCDVHSRTLETAPVTLDILDENGPIVAVPSPAIG